MSIFRDFLDDDCPTMAAALAYYAVFSLPAVLFLLLALIGLIMDPRSVQERILSQFGDMVGGSSAQQLEVMVRSARSKTAGAGVGVAMSIAALIFGGTGAFMQLQKALNRAWEVRPDPKQSGIKHFLVKRLLSAGVVLTIAFLLLVSLAISALLSALGDYLGALLGGTSALVLAALQFVLSFAVITALFALMFKVLPDAETAWRDAWIGGAVTAALFTLGKFAIGFYLGQSDPGSAFGAAGALAIIMIWIYYSAMIVLLGAEFTQVHALTKGAGIREQPEKGGTVKALF